MKISGSEGKRGAAGPRPADPDAALIRWAPWILLGTVWTAYHNSFTGPFIFDGNIFIENNPRIRTLWPVGELLKGTTRPITRLTFAINYAFNALDVFGYHLVNFAIHVLAAWTLFGLLRRTFSSPRVDRYKGRIGAGTALSVALLWAVHPLQTESVTYIFQRAESLMGLFYLFTIYALARAAQNPKGGRRWYAASWSACAIGMGCKAVMVTAPLAALFYDRIFWADSWRDLWNRRRIFYAALAATWIPLAIIVASPHESRSSVGWTMRFVTPLSYALTQPGVILHYLRLVFWPSDLVLDYVWLPARRAATIIPALGAVCALLWVTVRMLHRKPELRFLGVWFFLILMPTSSFLPVADLAAEHRMYLPLAAVVCATVLAAKWAIRRAVSSRPSEGVLGTCVLLAVASILCLRTVNRNDDYRSRRTMWTQVVKLRPLNPRARMNLGVALQKQGFSDEAIAAYREAFDIRTAHTSQSIDADLLCSNLAAAHISKGQLAEAIYFCRQALKANPRSMQARGNLASALAAQGRFEDASRELLDALTIYPESPVLHDNLGLVLDALGRPDEAIEQYREVVRLRNRSPEAYLNLAVALVRSGRLREAFEPLDSAQKWGTGKPEMLSKVTQLRTAVQRGLEKKLN